MQNADTPEIFSDQNELVEDQKFGESSLGYILNNLDRDINKERVEKPYIKTIKPENIMSIDKKATEESEEKILPIGGSCVTTLKLRVKSVYMENI